MNYHHIAFVFVIVVCILDHFTFVFLLRPLSCFYGHLPVIFCWWSLTIVFFLFDRKTKMGTILCISEWSSNKGFRTSFPYAIVCWNFCVDRTPRSLPPLNKSTHRSLRYYFIQLYNCNERFFSDEVCLRMNKTISHMELLSLNPNQIFVGVINNQSYSDKTWIIRLFLGWLVLVDVNCNIYFRVNMTYNTKLFRANMTYNPNKLVRANMTYRTSKIFCANMTYNPNKLFGATMTCNPNNLFSCKHDTSELQTTHNNEDYIDIRLSDLFLYYWLRLFHTVLDRE